MRDRNYWAALVRDRMRQRGVSQRDLERELRVDRTSFRRFLRGEPNRLGIDMLDLILAYLGYELDAIKRDHA